jgi:biotin synthase
MLTADQAVALREAGLDYYNHNLDTSPEYYGQVVTTRTYQERLDTLEHVRAAGMSTCCGGIVGMGETRRDRAGLLHALATLPAHPDSLRAGDFLGLGRDGVFQVEDHGVGGQRAGLLQRLGV